MKKNKIFQSFLIGTVLLLLIFSYFVYRIIFDAILFSNEKFRHFFVAKTGNEFVQAIVENDRSKLQNLSHLENSYYQCEGRAENLANTNFLEYQNTKIQNIEVKILPSNHGDINMYIARFLYQKDGGDEWKNGEISAVVVMNNSKFYVCNSGF